MAPPPSLEAARAQAGAQSIRLSDGVTAYYLHGSTGPWVVLVHGLLTSMYAWQPLAEAIAAAGFRVLRYDQLGRGLSDRPRLRYDLELYVRQLRELTAALDIEAAHHITWSMGSIVSSRFALEEPARVQRLVLIAPGLFVAQPRGPRLISLLPLADKIIARLVGWFIDRLPAQHLVRPELHPEYGQGMREQLDHPGVGEAFASTVKCYEWNAGPEFHRVGEHARPVLLVWGDDDPATPYANAPRVREIYPRAELLTLPGARHAPHIDHAQETHAAIIEFLSRTS